MKRTKALSAMFVALAAALLFSMSMSVAYATKPMPVSGTFGQTAAGSSTAWQAGESDNHIVTFSGVTIAWTGDISGTASYDGRWVIHNYGDPMNAWVNSIGLYTIEATVDGKSGTLYIEGLGNSGNPQPSTWRIIRGTDELANLHGQGTFEPNLATPNPFDYLYSGNVHFDP
jgi:hypothetical protein